MKVVGIPRILLQLKRNRKKASVCKLYALKLMPQEYENCHGKCFIFN